MAQAALTKKALADSLKKLASEKLFEHITVGDIVEDCGLNRQTFYYHFRDRFELLDWIYYTETFVPLTADITFENWNEKLQELLQIMRTNKNFYMNTIKCSNNYFEEYLQKMLITLMRTAISDLDTASTISEHKMDMYSKVFSYGLTGVIIEWAMNGMREDEAEMASNMKELTNIVMRLSYEVYTFRKTSPQDPSALPEKFQVEAQNTLSDVDFIEIENLRIP